MTRPIDTDPSDRQGARPTIRWSLFLAVSLALSASLALVPAPDVWGQDLFEGSPFEETQPEGEPEGEPGDAAADGATTPQIQEFTPRNRIESISPRTTPEALAAYNEGLALKERQDLLGAIGKFQAVKQLDRMFVPAYYELGRAYIELKDYANAQSELDFLKQMMQNPPPEIFEAQGELDIKSKAYTQAAEVLSYAANLDYLNAELATKAGEARLLESLTVRGRTAVQQAITQAIALLDRALKIQPDNAQALLLRGRANLVKARGGDELDLDKAIADLTKALELEPKNIQSAAQLGQALYSRAQTEASRHLGSTKKVLADLPRAVELLQRYATEELAATTKEQRQEKNKERVPDEPSAFQALATAGAASIKLATELQGAERKKYLQLGEKLCKKSIAEEPRSPDGYFQLGLAYRLMGDYQRAIEAFSHSISIDEGNPESYLRRGICYYYAGQRGQAASDLRRALDFQPDARASFWLGLIHASNGQHEEAIRLFSVALDLTRNNYPLASLNRGLSYLQLGDYDRAERDFGDTLKRDPQNRQAQQLLESLRRTRRLTANN